MNSYGMDEREDPQERGYGSITAMPSVPVECPECKHQTFVINPGDKYYCLNEQCLFQARLPTDPGMVNEENRRVYRYYVRKLAEEVIKFRGFDHEKFRRGEITGVPLEDQCLLASSER